MSNKTLNIGQILELQLLEKGTDPYSQGDLKLRVAIDFEGCRLGGGII